ncbi:hypothetical protein U9M48_033874 [Paspalum notatum var. saurae]|uniref:Uncharacterized protein n=1 Tax=Paspalum notatum var. saurae TaxID=547442 RepID=A0AAQ3U808_PASNO
MTRWCTVPPSPSNEAINSTTQSPHQPASATPSPTRKASPNGRNTAADQLSPLSESSPSAPAKFPHCGLIRLVGCIRFEVLRAPPEFFLCAAVESARKLMGSGGNWRVV